MILSCLEYNNLIWEYFVSYIVVFEVGGVLDVEIKLVWSCRRIGKVLEFSKLLNGMCIVG